VRDDTAQHVASASDGVRLQDLRDQREPVGDLVVPARLAQLKRHERGDPVAERRRIDIGTVAGDHATALQPVQPGLDRAASYAEPPGRLQDPDPRLGGQQLDRSGIECIDHKSASPSHPAQLLT